MVIVELELVIVQDQATDAITPGRQNLVVSHVAGWFTTGTVGDHGAPVVTLRAPVEAGLARDIEERPEEIFVVVAHSIIKDHLWTLEHAIKPAVGVTTTGTAGVPGVHAESEVAAVEVELVQDHVANTGQHPVEMPTGALLPKPLHAINVVLEVAAGTAGAPGVLVDTPMVFVEVALAQDHAVTDLPIAVEHLVLGLPDKQHLAAKHVVKHITIGAVGGRGDLAGTRVASVEVEHVQDHAASTRHHPVVMHTVAPLLKPKNAANVVLQVVAGTAGVLGVLVDFLMVSVGAEPKFVHARTDLPHAVVHVVQDQQQRKSHAVNVVL